jgi:hypothetical protein
MDFDGTLFPDPTVSQFEAAPRLMPATHLAIVRAVNAVTTRRVTQFAGRATNVKWPAGIASGGWARCDKEALSVLKEQ